MGFVRQFAALLFIIAVPVALVTTNVRIAVNEPRVYEYAADHYDTPTTTGIPRPELLHASGELREYFNNGEGSIAVSVRDNQGNLVTLFTPQEALHLQDVKALFKDAFRVQEVSILFVLAYVVGVFVWAREGSLRTLAKQLLISGVVSVAVIGVVGGIAAAGFDQSFEQFHQVAFDNDLWQLDPSSDRLIQMFPEAFWQDLSLWIGIGTLVELAALSAIAGAYLALNRRRASAPMVLPGSAQA